MNNSGHIEPLSQVYLVIVRKQCVVTMRKQPRFSGADHTLVESLVFFSCRVRYQGNEYVAIYDDNKIGFTVETDKRLRENFKIERKADQELGLRVLKGLKLK